MLSVPTRDAFFLLQLYVSTTTEFIKENNNNNSTPVNLKVF
jgi:hypothetical protein